MCPHVVGVNPQVILIRMEMTAGIAVTRHYLAIQVFIEKCFVSTRDLSQFDLPTVYV